MKLNENGECVVEHHIRYKEIHGYDKTIWITQSEHLKLHNRLRKNGKCNIPVDKLQKIASAAYGRTDKAATIKKKYQQTERSKKIHANYLKNNVYSFYFYNWMMVDVKHREAIRYNLSTGNINVSCIFMTDRHKQLINIEI